MSGERIFGDCIKQSEIPLNAVGISNAYLYVIFLEKS